MDKLVITGIAVGVGLVGYKAAVYGTALYKLKQAKKQKVVSLGTVSEYKKKLEQEKEK